MIPGITKSTQNKFNAFYSALFLPFRSSAGGRSQDRYISLHWVGLIVETRFIGGPGTVDITSYCIFKMSSFIIAKLTSFTSYCNRASYGILGWVSVAGCNTAVVVGKWTKS